MLNKTHLSDLTPQELAPWLDLPISKLLIQRLRDEETSALNHIANKIDEGKIDEARITKGGLNLVRLLLRDLFPPDAPPETVDDTFVHPNAIARPVRA